MRSPAWRTLALVLVLYLVLGLLQRGWWTLRTPINLLNDGAALALVALGQAIVLAAGGIDLSVGAMLALASMAVACSIEAGCPAAVALAAAPLAGAAAGASIGAWIHWRRLPAFLVTLAAMLGLRGVAHTLHAGALTIRDADHAMFASLGISFGGGLVLAPGAIIALLATAAGGWFLVGTRTGRDFLAIGGDADAARLLGVPVGARLILAYALSGGCAAMAGAVHTLNMHAGNPNAGLGLELDAIAAAVIGGASLRGGAASAAGALLGVVLLGMIQTAITFDGRLGSGWARLASGVLLLGFAASQAWLHAPGLEEHSEVCQDGCAVHVAVRNETHSDWPQVDRIVRSAFGQAAEAQLVARLRAEPGILSLVATVDDAAVAHAMFSPVTARGRSGGPLAYGLAPVSVEPAWQRCGVGSRLIERGLAELRRAGASLVVVLGHAAYYPRFGFVAAAPLGLTCKWGGDDGTFQALELVIGAASAFRGIVDYHPMFDEFAW